MGSKVSTASLYSHRMISISARSTCSRSAKRGRAAYRRREIRARTNSIYFHSNASTEANAPRNQCDKYLVAIPVFPLWRLGNDIFDMSTDRLPRDPLKSCCESEKDESKPKNESPSEALLSLNSANRFVLRSPSKIEISFLPLLFSLLISSHERHGRSVSGGCFAFAVRIGLLKVSSKSPKVSSRIRANSNRSLSRLEASFSSFSASSFASTSPLSPLSAMAIFTNKSAPLASFFVSVASDTALIEDSLVSRSTRNAKYLSHADLTSQQVESAHASASARMRALAWASGGLNEDNLRLLLLFFFSNPAWRIPSIRMS
mmetsp:Transcript_26773/g.48624  ORF Transcript_26773/g.48624 Transcript_26773/m.48624 type:complete len:317 (-) Transcript_26773:2068-3018(-)